MFPSHDQGGPVGFRVGSGTSNLMRQLSQASRTKDTEEIVRKIVVEIKKGSKSVTGTFPAAQQEDLLAMLSSIQARS